MNLRRKKKKKKKNWKVAAVKPFRNSLLAQLRRSHGFKGVTNQYCLLKHSWLCTFDRASSPQD
jgi:hypothetical protein